MGLREALLADGRKLLEKLLSGLKVEGDEARAGERTRANRKKEVETVLGKITISRSYYWNEKSGEGRTPLDEALGLVEGYSPGMARLMCRSGARNSYEEAAQDLKIYGGIEVEGREIQRMVNRIAPQMQKVLDAEKCDPEQKEIPILYVNADATGIPMTPSELEGKKGKQEDGSAKHREIKLGCVFTQTSLDEKGNPLRDYQSSSYITGFDDPQNFGIRLRQESFRRGMSHAQKIVFISDGAPWLAEIQRQNFPFATSILDFYHAAEHLTRLAEALWPNQENETFLKEKTKHWRELLMDDSFEKIQTEAQKHLPHHGQRRDNTLRELNYFKKNRERIRYKKFREQGLFIGSGIIEAGCKTVIAQRAKHSGMHWSSPGALNALSLRAALKSNRFNSYFNHPILTS